jgi:hypothetical protein
MTLEFQLDHQNPSQSWLLITHDLLWAQGAILPLMPSALGSAALARRSACFLEERAEERIMSDWIVES